MRRLHRSVLLSRRRLLPGAKRGLGPRSGWRCASNRSTAHRFWTLLNQFASGTYRLDHDEAGADVRYWELNYTSEFDDHDSIYHYANECRPNHALLPTQNTDLRNEDRILEWATLIAGGQRPTILTTMVDGADSEIVLDGHHKIAGYELAGVAPRRLSIVWMDPPALRLADWPSGRVVHHPESWPKALALKPRRWPHDAEPIDADLEYLRRAKIARRLGIPAPNPVGFLRASYAQVYEYSPDFKRRDVRGWITSPAKLGLLHPGVAVGLDGADIVQVAVLESRTRSDDGMAGWVPLVATTFADRFDIRTRTINFAPRALSK